MNTYRIAPATLTPGGQRFIIVTVGDDGRETAGSTHYETPELAAVAAIEMFRDDIRGSEDDHNAN